MDHQGIVPLEPIPVFIVLTSEKPLAEPIYMRNLRINLISRTRVTSQGIERERVDSQQIEDLQHLSLLAQPRSVIGVKRPYSGYNELTFDSIGWENASLPENVPPTFKTCNISRRYILEYVMGLSLKQKAQLSQVEFAFCHVSEPLVVTTFVVARRS